MADPKTPDGLTTITLICAHCSATTHNVGVVGFSGSSELELFNLARPEAEQAGWERRGRPGEFEWVCPLCIDREKHPERLLPFTGPGRKCPKCLGRPVAAEFSRVGGDHLLRTCKTCGYQWQETTAPAPRPWWRIW